MNVPDRIKELTETFDYNLESYKKGIYNETQVRREFIDPFFEELGWDVANKKGYAEAYKDVIHEDAIKVGGVTKAPDYCFRIGGARKFFLEAKKPSINIQEGIDPAYQLRRYGWSAKLPLSILTDFEEFAVYDCRVKPVKTDKVSHSRILYLKYTDYADRWEEIASVFSRDAILKGSFDKYIESNKIRKGTTEVDAAFLQEIERWRELLARNIALRNPDLSQRELNFAVQQTIDRIVFLRICEDRGMEAYGGLMALRNGENVYRRLFHLFNKADEKYNSGLFHFTKEKDRENYDNLTPFLQIDDKPLKDIFNNLYYPESPYEFSVLSADILGQVYEKFLGKVIRLTAGHQAKIEEKPEVRKAGGVYYTPGYIVDYIVKNTVGKLVEGKKPGPRGGVSHLKILDPACGSGSFLIGAYQFLLDWHRDEYINDGPENWSKGKTPRIYQSRKGEWRLTTEERKRILTNNIYGVDIDHQAVEVTKLSLLLKVLEGEDEQSIGKQMLMFQKRVLPDLSNNIKCGNSLIGPDFYEHQQMSLLGEGEIFRVNAFDWNAEFAEIMKDGGFDAVIGNPPWGAELSERELSYLRRTNKDIIVRMIDSFMYFIHQSSQKVKTLGYFGMILPDVLLYQIDNEKLRRYIINNFRIKNILNMGDVFDKVSRPSSILIFENSNPSTYSTAQVADLASFIKTDKVACITETSRYERINQRDLNDIPGALFITSKPDKYKIWAKINEIPNNLLNEVVDADGIQRGVSPDLKEAFLVDSNTANKFQLEEKKLKKSVTGGVHVKRYFINQPDLWLIYTSRNDDFQKLPKICKYIDQFKNEITCKEVKQNKHSIYSLHRPRKEQIFLKNEKILGVITGDRIIAALDDSRVYPTDGLYLLGVDKMINANYLLGILNSKLFVFIYRLLAIEKGRILPQVKPTILSKLPIRTLNLQDSEDKYLYDQIISLVDQMLELNKKLAESKVPQTTEMLRRQIESTDKQIDQLVYKLYDLTEEEIKIVESET